MTRRPTYHGSSFADRHPILSWIAIIAFAVIGGFPLIAMSSKTVACAIGAAKIWCEGEQTK